ncbi:MAG TPA: thiamine pyrophosphate-dependent enzyme [Hyphomicrobiaceae bacterium]|nr:thiamine pyrophosphate-dependent enzyme [Hyphomicrobiaceae bacterium]
MSDTQKTQSRLQRGQAVPKLIGNPDDFLIVTGLAGPAKDIGAMVGDAPNTFQFAGAMGGAVATALGLALAQPTKRVLCVTGDGDLLMSMGSLAMVGALKPSNLSVICVDNALYQETGGQPSHTSMGVDLATIASGSGFPVTRDVSTMEELDEAASVLRNTNSTAFVLLRVDASESPKNKRNLHAAETKVAFRKALLGTR